jgi:flagellar hook protein FlgE
MSFQQGLSGLSAAAKNLEVIGNNVANSTTVGFKGSHAIFADMYAHSFAGSGPSAAGIGTTVAAVQASFAQGNITATSNPLDLAVNGNGFFVLDTNGATSYSRNGQFHLDSDGFVVNATGAKITGYGVSATNAIVASAPGPLQVSTAALPPAATTTSAVGVNLDSRDPVITVPFSIANSASYNNSSSMSIFDSLGNAHTLSSYYVKTAANTWSVYGAMDGVALAAPMGALTFSSNGLLPAALLPFSVSVPLANGATTPFAFAMDLKTSTQFGANFAVNSLTQNGSTAGSLAGYGVAEDGTLQGRYSNGLTRTLGQFVLANFANDEGLEPLGGNGFAETTASGQPLVGTPGSGSFGAMQSGAVEESNVDLTQQLVDMITAQRVYQANAQTIKTQDQIMNTLVNLR